MNRQEQTTDIEALLRLSVGGGLRHVAPESIHHLLEGELSGKGSADDAHVARAAGFISRNPDLQPPRPRGLPRFAGAVAVAAAIVLLFASPLDRAVPPQHRDATDTSAPTPRLVRATVTNSATVFHWTPVPGALGYELTVFDAGGAIVTSVNGHDTTAVVAFAPDSATYFWQVRARMDAGRWAESAVEELVSR